MDLKTNIYNAISDGDLTTLSNLLASHSRARKNDIVSFKVDDTTLLLIAARNGHCEVVEYLITECGVDVEEVGKVEFDGETIDNAPPLWCSAAVGCLKCVEMLVNHGANVNSTTSTNSTPLRAACFDGHFPIVEYLVRQGADIEIANQHGHTCLMISCYKKHYNIAAYLIQQGAKINRQSVKGNTALHDCAESNSMDIMKLLVRKGAVFHRDCYGLTPLECACLSGNKEMVEYLKSVFKCPIEKEVDAYKLLGATYVDKFCDLTTAVDFWRQAIRKSSDCDQKYHESLNNANESYREAYGNAKECQTEEDLNELYCDPDQMKMQSLIIRERILGIHHPETYYFIRYRGAAYADSGDYTRCLSLWMYNLERQQNAYKPLSEMTQNSFLSIIELFSFMFLKCDSSVRICDIFRVLKLAITELLSSSNISTNCDMTARLYRLFERKLVSRKDSRMFNGDISGLDRHFLIVIQLLGFMCQLRPKMSSKEWRSFRKSLYEFVAFEPRSACSFTLLHVLCLISQNELSNSVKIPVIDIFKLVVDVSRNLDNIDLYGNTALHLLFNQPKLKTSMVTYLLEAGAHPDRSNEDGLTPLDYSANANSFKVKFLSLQCRCAHLVAKKNIPFDSLSRDLQDFVMMHQSKGYSSNVYQS